MIAGGIGASGIAQSEKSSTKRTDFFVCWDERDEEAVEGERERGGGVSHDEEDEAERDLSRRMEEHSSDA